MRRSRDEGRHGLASVEAFATNTVRLSCTKGLGSCELAKERLRLRRVNTDAKLTGVKCGYVSWRRIETNELIMGILSGIKLMRGVVANHPETCVTWSHGCVVVGRPSSLIVIVPTKALEVDDLTALGDGKREASTGLYSELFGTENFEVVSKILIVEGDFTKILPIPLLHGSTGRRRRRVTLLLVLSSKFKQGVVNEGRSRENVDGTTSTLRELSKHDVTPRSAIICMNLNRRVDAGVDRVKGITRPFQNRRRDVHDCLGCWLGGRTRRSDQRVVRVVNVPVVVRSVAEDDPVLLLRIAFGETQTVRVEPPTWRF